MFSKWPLIAGIGLILALLAALGVQEYRIRGMKLDAAQTAQKQAETYAARLKAVADREHDTSERMTAIAEGTQHDIADIKARTSGIPAAIRAGTLQLRDYFTSQAGVPASASSTGQPDEGARLRAEGYASLVRIPAECDAQVRGLQQLIREDRRLCNGQ